MYLPLPPVHCCVMIFSLGLSRCPRARAPDPGAGFPLGGPDATGGSSVEPGQPRIEVGREDDGSRADLSHPELLVLDLSVQAGPSTRHPGTDFVDRKRQLGRGFDILLGRHFAVLSSGFIGALPCSLGASLGCHHAGSGAVGHT